MSQTTEKIEKNEGSRDVKLDDVRREESFFWGLLEQLGTFA
jgi:hypothetical protein